MTFEIALDKIISLEGGYTLHQNKTESEVTYAGIYRKSFPNWTGWSYVDKSLTPPKELVSEFYLTNFWDTIEVKNTSIKYLLFEFGINAGAKKADMIANSINSNYKELEDENEVKIFILSFTIGRIKYYTNLANKNPKKYGIYLRGWINRALKAIS